MRTPSEYLAIGKTAVKYSILENVTSEAAELAKRVERLAQALDEAITIIVSIDGRDNSCDPKTNIDHLRAALKLASAAQFIEHDFRVSVLARYPHWLCCIKCGIVKRADGKTGPCKGEVKVVLRNEAHEA